jgi:hypothetical protein
MGGLSAPAERPGLPPWLWVWAGLFLAGFEGIMAQVAGSIDGLVLLIEGTARIQAIDPAYGRLHFLLYPSVVLDLLPLAMLALGLLAVLGPRVRAVTIERWERLAPSSQAAVAEIAQFTRHHAPTIEVMANAVSARHLLFGYPAGYRRVRLAVFAPFLALWRRDRKAAEPVLLHEIAHARRGDFLITGAGSLFSALISSMFVLYLVLGLFPTLVVIADQVLASRSQLLALGMTEVAVLGTQAGRFASITIPGLLLSTIAQFFDVVRYLILPVVALWCLELEADRAAADHAGAESVRRALAMATKRSAWWRWLLFRLAHPPLSLRRWALDQGRATAFLLLLLLFPLAYYVRLLVLHARAVPLYLSIETPPAEIVANTLQNTRSYLMTAQTPFFVIAAALLLWPFVAARWTAFFAGQPPRPARAEIVPYAVAATITALLALAGRALAA